MVEVLVAGSLIGLGYLVNKDNERSLDEDITPLKIKKNKKILYDKSIVNNANNEEKKMVINNTKKSKNAIDTNIIPLHFNDRIVNNRTTKIQYLENDSNTYLDRPIADRSQRDKDITDNNDKIRLEHFYNPLVDNNPPNNSCNSNKMFFSSLSNTYMDEDEFKHQNMVPFFSGNSVKQNISDNATKGIFDAYQGYNSYQFPKQTIEPMFTPKKDLGFVNGTPNVSEQVFERFVPSMYRTNEVPIEPIRVGPGLNSGYSSKPTGGFQQFDTQTFALPRTTDEIRPLNNPKITYDGRPTGAPKSLVSNRGLQSNINKNKPDTFYEQTPCMYLKTTGAYIKAEMPGEYTDKETNRQESISYEGIAAPSTTFNEPLRPEIKESTNINYVSDGPRNVSLSNYNDPKKNNYSVDSYTVKPNERQNTENKSIITNITANVKAIIAPLLDLLKTTRKEDVIGNPNKVGYMTGPVKSVVYDPNDIAKTTIKETNIHNTKSGNMNIGITKGPVYDPNDVAKTTIKETNIHNNRGAKNIATNVSKGPVYNPNDVAKTTLKETNIHNNRGAKNMATNVSKGPVYDPNDIAKTTMKETNIHNTKSGNMNIGITKGPVYDPNDVAKTTIKETNIHNNRGAKNIATNVSKGPAYDPNDVAKTTIKETNIHNTRGAKNMATNVVKGPVYDPNDIAKTTIKETNIHNNRGAKNMATNVSKGPVYDPNDIAKTTMKETNIHNNRGAKNMAANVSKGPVYDPNDIAKTTMKETNIHNTRGGRNIAAGITKGPAYDPNNIVKTTMKETNIHNSKTGNMSSGVKKGPSYDPNDIARTTIKETNIHNTSTGNMSNKIIKGPVYDPNDIAKTTVKETNIHNVHTGSVGVSVKTGVVHIPEDKTRTTIKELIIDNKHFTNVKGPKKITVHDPNDIARTTIKETNIHNKSNGNLKNTVLQNGNGYLVQSYEDKNTNRQFTSDLDYTGIADGQVGHGNGDGYLTSNYEDKNTNRQFTGDYEYVGVADSYLDKPTNIDMYDETRLNEVKEGVSEGRYPTLNNVKIANGADTINMEIKKLEEDRENQYSPVADKLYIQTPTLNNATVTTDKSILNDESIIDRLNPDILNAFNSNPYTHSLNSYM